MSSLEREIDIVYANSNTGNKECISLKLRGKITIITGDSGSGKTYITEVIQRAQANSDGFESNFDLSNIEIVGLETKIVGSLTDYLKILKGKLIIIDEADVRLAGAEHRESRYYIEKDIDSTYILMVRGTKSNSFGATPANIATVKFENNKFYLHYQYDVGGW